SCFPFFSSEALLLDLPLVTSTSGPIEVDRNYSEAYEEVTLLCRKEELNFGNCLFDWLRCYNRRGCGRDYMLMKLICSGKGDLGVTHPRHGGLFLGTLLVSPLVVAGIVIGLVLFLSCVTIIVGSLRKDGRLPPDGYSYSGSIGELRSTCIEELPPVFDFDSYMESLSQVNVLYPDSPPNYEECVGPGATQIYIPTDDPPPYSLTDPCRWREQQEVHSCLEAGEFPNAASWAMGGRAFPSSSGPQGAIQQPIASVALAALPAEAAPPYEAIAGDGHNRPIPLIPMDLPKHTSPNSTARQAMPHGIL
uniref:Brain expressed, associated with NEDD4, 1 n=1 Tax=Paramormyrops kingsleyae TaxID=1676925 RepID=A0A3B3RY71_9TELE